MLTRRSWPAALVIVLVSCGPEPRRDLTTLPQRQITFDDMCRLQDFFDQRNAAHARPFRSLDEQSTETERTEPDETGRMRRVVLGEGTYVVSDRVDKRRLKQLLEEEYQRLPDLHLGPRDGEVQVRVSWWASGQMRRLRPDQSIVIRTKRETVELPFHPCVGEYLFGAPVYAMRHHVFESDLARARGEVPPPPVETEDSGSPADASDPVQPVPPSPDSVPNDAGTPNG